MTTIKRKNDKIIVLSVLRPFYCGHCIVCPSSFSLWSLHCLSFVLFIVVIALSVLQKGRRTDNAMTTMKRTKDRQCNDHNKKDEVSVLRPFYCGHCMVCPSSFSLWLLYCLSFVLFIVVIALSVLRPFHCGHCIVWTQDRQYNDHNKKDEEQTMQ
jgi:heme exporter protein D